MEDFIEVIDWIPMSAAVDNGCKFSMRSHSPVSYKNMQEYWDKLSDMETHYATAIIMSCAERNIKSWFHERGYPHFSDDTVACLSAYEFDDLIQYTWELLEE